MISPGDRVHLLDFGLARGVGVDMATLTRTGTILGTPAYMSPEQFDAFGVDGRSDLYSLGVVLFEILTGRLPFKGASLVSVALKHKTEPPPLPRSLRVEVPAWLERVVLRCLEKDPTRRFATAEELVAELRRPRKAGSRGGAPCPAATRSWRTTTTLEPGPSFSPRYARRPDGRRAWPCASVSATTVSRRSMLRRAETKRGPMASWPLAARRGLPSARGLRGRPGRAGQRPARGQPGRPSQGAPFP